MRKRGRPPKSIFPRTFKPLPTFQAPGAALQRLVQERRAARHRDLALREKARLRAIKAAFAEGATFGREWLDPAEAWWSSQAHRRLEPPAVRPGDGIRQWLHEVRLREDDDYRRRWHRRVAEIRDAFDQGHWAGACGWDLREAWQYSPIRKSLYPGPPTPPHLAARMIELARAFPQAGITFSEARRPGGPG